MAAQASGEVEDSDGITGLGELLRCLRSVDRDFRVFGSEKHKYRLGPVLSESTLSDFESNHSVRLPEDYRRFLATIGNGGAGPFFGLEPLGAFGRDLSKPFPLTQATEHLSKNELERLGDRDEYPGVLESLPSGLRHLLVLGRERTDLRHALEREGRLPPDRSALRCVVSSMGRKGAAARGNQKLVPRLRVGMCKADVISETGDGWVVRQCCTGPSGFSKLPIYQFNSNSMTAVLW